MRKKRFRGGKPKSAGFDRLNSLLIGTPGAFECGILNAGLVGAEDFNFAAITLNRDLAVRYLAAEDMTELVGTVQSIKRQINPRLKIGGVFLTMANETNFRKDTVITVKENFGEHLPVLDTVIPATVRLAEISTADKSIFQHEPRGRAADA